MSPLAKAEISCEEAGPDNLPNISPFMHLSRFLVDDLAGILMDATSYT